MIVQSVRNNQQYRLPQAPVSRQSDGVVYPVIGRPDLQIKIYSPANRTPAAEKQVIDTINGVTSMIGEFPIDMVRLDGRFAGYVFQTPQEPEPEEPKPPVRDDLSGGVRLLICAGITVLLSLLVYFPVFSAIQNMMDQVYCTWNFHGIPMVIGGIAATILAYSAARSMKSAPALVISTAAFVLGSAVVFGVVCLAVRAAVTAASAITAILPTIITIALIAFIVKSIFKR